MDLFDLDLARGFSHLIKLALAGAPDPEPRRRMEELLTRIG